MIRVEGLTKRYGKKTALDGISFVAESGQVYGLVGYNGAGKTTLLKTIAGVYLPDAGEVLFDGVPAHRSGDFSHVPFIVADEPYFLPQATPDTMRRFYRGYYPQWSDRLFDNLLELFGLDRDQKIAGFSKGMRRQMALMIGLASKASYLLLDESFDGLDVGKRDILKRLLRRYARAYGASVVLSSHNMEELQDVSDRIGMIKDTRLAFDRPICDFSPGELQRLFLEGEEVTEDELDAVFC